VRTLKNEWNLPQWTFFMRPNLLTQSFFRFGHMLNGRAEADWCSIVRQRESVVPLQILRLKEVYTYKIDGRNRLYLNGL
jgi:hypothetical protein